MTSESQKFNHQVALLCSNNYSSSSSNDSFSPIQDTSFSSFTDLYESQGTKFPQSWLDSDYGYLGCYFDQSDGEDPDDVPSLELRSFHKLQDAGLVRMRTRQIEARIRRKKSRRKKVKLPENSRCENFFKKVLTSVGFEPTRLLPEANALAPSP